MHRPVEWCGCRSKGPARFAAARPAARPPSPSPSRPPSISANSCHLLPERGFDFLVVAELQGLRADDLPGLVPLAGDQQHIARLECGHRSVNRLASVADLAHVWRTRRAVHDGGADRAGVFAPRIVIGDDDAVGVLGGYSAHQCTLALVTVAAGAEHNDELAFDIRPQR